MPEALAAFHQPQVPDQTVPPVAHADDFTMCDTRHSMEHALLNGCVNS